MSLVAGYKIFYNLLQTIGWSYILYSVVINYVNQEGPENVWPKVSRALIFFQNLAVLEVLHALVGLVKAPVMTTFIQVLSRVAITYVCMQIPPCREGYIFSLLMVSWSVIEIVRYSYYASQLMGVDIYIHKWLRYTLFIILYPSGVFSEIATLYFAIPYLQQNGLHGIADFPVFETVTMWALAVYILIFAYLPGFPVMFGHMVKQRKSRLSTRPSSQKQKRN